MRRCGSDHELRGRDLLLRRYVLDEAGSEGLGRPSEEENLQVPSAESSARTGSEVSTCCRTIERRREVKSSKSMVVERPGRRMVLRRPSDEGPAGAMYESGGGGGMPVRSPPMNGVDGEVGLGLVTVERKRSVESKNDRDENEWNGA